jgi:hypothetical protein
MPSASASEEQRRGASFGIPRVSRKVLVLDQVLKVVAVNVGVGCELNVKDAYPSWDSHGTSLGESPEFVGISPPPNGRISFV